MSKIFSLDQSDKIRIIAFIAVFAVVASSLPSLIKYLKINYSFGNLALLLVPFLFYIQHNGIRSFRFGFLTLLTLTGYAVNQTPVLIFFAIFSFICYILEILIGKINHLATWAVVIITPATKYFFDLSGFEIRIFLTKTAAKIIGLFSDNVSSIGNQIVLNGKIYLVDTQCAGLKMVITSFLICLIIISYFERKNKKESRFFVLLSLMLITFGLSVLNNLFRIVLLVLFRSEAESVSHQLLGIVTLALTVVIPLLIIIEKIFAHNHIFKRNNYLPKTDSYKAKRFKIISITLGFLLLLYMQYFIEPLRINEDRELKNISLTGYTKEILQDNVVRFTSERVLIYIKPQNHFYESDHNPMICWRASGYKIISEKNSEFYNIQLYLGEIEIENQIWYTAWWYDNGRRQTTSQFLWRWWSITGSPKFRLINITSRNLDDIYQEIQKISEISNSLNKN